MFLGDTINHSWDSVEKLIKSDLTKDILVDVGM